ncbi:MAG: flagellar hook-associated protein FlgL [Pseudomonadota bacterium]
MRISTAQFISNGAQAITDQQADLVKTQSQMSSGLAVLTPSDDPLAANLILKFEQEITISERYIEIGGAAEGLVSLEETTLNSMTDLLNRIRDLMISGGNGNYSQLDRQAIAEEVQALLDEAIGLANTQTASGEYLFSGFQLLTQPYTMDATGAVIYNGDQGQRTARVNDSVVLATSDPGYDIFDNVLNGNGIIQIFDEPTNTGTGVIDPGSVNTANYTDETYTISFVTNSDDELAYNVFDSAGTQIIPAPPLDPVLDAVTYTEGEDIIINNEVTTNITGTPSDTANANNPNPLYGDFFTIAPSSKQSVFVTIQNAVDALLLPQNNESEQAEFQNAMNRVLMDIDRNMENIDRIRSSLGARLNAIQNEIYVNQDLIIAISIDLSRVRDLDYVEATTRLTAQITSLEAAQASFARVQNLSLFNFL